MHLVRLAGSAFLGVYSLASRVRGDFAKSFEGDFEVIDPSTRSTGHP